MRISQANFCLCGSILLAAAVARADFVQSAAYPLRVNFADSSSEAYARAVLSAAEQSWAFQVDELGFLPPPGDNGYLDSDDYDVVVGSTAWGALAKSLYSAADRVFGRSSYILVDPQGVPDWALPLVISHEFHHAIQLGIRPAGTGVLEPGALYISELQNPGDAYILSYYLGINAFQAHPEFSLDWEAEPGNFYPYGAVLFFLFLEQQYGEPTTAALYKSMWDLLAASSVPDYFGALSQVVNLDAAFATFATWRYFVGPEDDGRHIQNLSQWEGLRDGELTSVAISKDLSASDLPAQIVSEGTGPMPYGTSYVRVDLTGLGESKTLHVRFSGEPALHWSVSSILAAGSQPAEESEIMAIDGLASFEVPGGQFDAVVIACTNLGDGQYAPDGAGWRASTFVLDLQIRSTDEDRRHAGAQSGEGCHTVPCTPLAAWLVVMLVLRRSRRVDVAPTRP